MKKDWIPSIARAWRVVLVTDRMASDLKNQPWILNSSRIDEK